MDFLSSWKSFSEASSRNPINAFLYCINGFDTSEAESLRFSLSVGIIFDNWRQHLCKRNSCVYFRFIFGSDFRQMLYLNLFLSCKRNKLSRRLLIWSKPFWFIGCIYMVFVLWLLLGVRVFTTGRILFSYPWYTLGLWLSIQRSGAARGVQP